VQTERRLTALVRGEHYEKRYAWTPLEQISPNLQHAVVAGEDARFYLHHGFDWKEIDRALDDDREDGRLRGASTITQQLVRNLFLSTQHSFVRKAVEASIVPFAEFLLGKRRILELYLNVIEWGPGIYGAEAASHTYYRSSCATLSREQAAQLASVIPAPLRRKPGKAPAYASRILTRMRQMGW
jgi:monofunctional biosynthetic peptidoglycan transglycosylase